MGKYYQALEQIDKKEKKNKLMIEKAKHKISQLEGKINENNKKIESKRSLTDWKKNRSFIINANVDVIKLTYILFLVSVIALLICEAVLHKNVRPQFFVKCMFAFSTYKAKHAHIALISSISVLMIFAVINNIANVIMNLAKFYVSLYRYIQKAAFRFLQLVTVFGLIIKFNRSMLGEEYRSPNAFLYYTFSSPDTSNSNSLFIVLCFIFAICFVLFVADIIFALNALKYDKNAQIKALNTTLEIEKIEKEIDDIKLEISKNQDDIKELKKTLGKEVLSAKENAKNVYNKGKELYDKGIAEDNIDLINEAVEYDYQPALYYVIKKDIFSMREDDNVSEYEYKEACKNYCDVLDDSLNHNYDGNLFVLYVYCVTLTNDTTFDNQISESKAKEYVNKLTKIKQSKEFDKDLAPLSVKAFDALDSVFFHFKNEKATSVSYVQNSSYNNVSSFDDELDRRISARFSGRCAFKDGYGYCNKSKYDEWSVGSLCTNPYTCSMFEPC